MSHVFISMTAFMSGLQCSNFSLSIASICLRESRGDSFKPSLIGVSLSGWSHVSVSMRRAGSKPSLHVRTGRVRVPPDPTGRRSHHGVSVSCGTDLTFRRTLL